MREYAEFLHWIIREFPNLTPERVAKTPWYILHGIYQDGFKKRVAKQGGIPYRTAFIHAKLGAGLTKAEAEAEYEQRQKRLEQEEKVKRLHLDQRPRGSTFRPKGIVKN